MNPAGEEVEALDTLTDALACASVAISLASVCEATVAIPHEYTVKRRAHIAEFDRLLAEIRAVYRAALATEARGGRETEALDQGLDLIAWDLRQAARGVNEAGCRIVMRSCADHADTLRAAFRAGAPPRMDPADVNAALADAIDAGYLPTAPSPAMRQGQLDGVDVWPGLPPIVPSPAEVEPDALDRFTVAVCLAAMAHAGQIYAGHNGHPPTPYILHPMRVASAVSESAQIVAVLHDMLEDTGGIAPPWLSHEERDALDAITRRDEETYADYIQRCGAHPIAREVKIADLRDNLAHDPPGDLRERYAKALEALRARPASEPEPVGAIQQAADILTRALDWLRLMIEPDDRVIEVERLVIAARARLAASEPEQPASPSPTHEGWRGIESIPRDGTRVLMWNGYNRWVASHWDPTISAMAATHWMPLPAPPAEPTPPGEQP